jgi:hypothetical protein
MRFNKSILFLFLIIGTLVFVSSAYTLSNPQLTRGGTFSSFERDPTDTSFDPEMCREGQDFVVQVAPFGCEPAVVRSDLLEEQDVPVFCKLQAIKINPFIDITSIDSINIRGEYPREVKSVGFTPSYSALGENKKLNNLQWDEIGYATIILRQNPNESSIPDFVTGNLSAKITYDLKNAFGLRKHTFYLPVLEDNEFDSLMGQYSFFNNMGYLRAEDVTKDSASIAIYSGRYEAPFGKSRTGEISRQRINNYNLQVGQDTGKIYLPGFDCFSAVQFKLDDIEFQDTRVRLNVNSRIYEVKEKERFLDNKCYVRNIEKSGLNQIVTLTCEEDKKSETFDLVLSPKIVLKIDGNEKEYSVGDYLFETDEGQYAYLGYVGSRTYNAEDLVAYIVFSKQKIPKLEKSEIYAAGKLGELNVDEKTVFNELRHISAYSANLVGWIRGYGFNKLDFSEEKNVGGKVVEIIGFGSEEDFPINPEIENYYEKALENYEYVFANYRGENYPEDDQLTLGEKSLYAKILLARDISQKKDLSFFCDEFETTYPDSELDVSSFCENAFFLSNQEVSTRDSIINGETNRISFEGIYQPSFEDYGVELYVRNKSGKIESYKLRKDQVVYLNEEGQDYVQLISINDEDSVTLNVHVKKTGLANVQDVLISGNRILKKDISQTFNTNYTFTVHDINFERVAKVSVEPSINYAGSDVDFNFAIGVEKRGIQLSPETTQNKIDELNKTIKKWEDISNTLSNTVDLLEDTCFAVGGFLTLKNLITNSGGESIARKEVMSGSGGWYDRCAELISAGNYQTEEECLQDNSQKIDSEVSILAEMLKKQNNEIKKLQESEDVSQEQGLFGDTVVNRTKLVEKYLPKVKETLERREIIENPRTGETISVSSLDKILTPEGWKKNLFSLDLLKEIEFYSNVLEEGDLSESQRKVYQGKLYEKVNKLKINSEKFIDVSSWADEMGTDSYNIDFIEVNGKAYELAYGGLTLKDLSVNLEDVQFEENTPVKLVQASNGRKYILILDDSSGIDKLPILRDDDFNPYVFDGKGKRLSEVPKEILNIVCIKYDSSSYRNSYKNPEIKYYETDPHKGLPAVVPFDTQNGWYAYVEQSIDFGREIRSYDKSARVNSFWLCNVGDNGLEEFSRGDAGDDICQLINLGTGQPYNQFSGLKEGEASRKINQAVNAIEKASRAYKSGVSTVSIGDQNIQVGSPAIDRVTSKCEDYMSPDDCNLLFNVCDPVICPSSRCDFGGQYPVKDVIQSGIVGSLLLCLPNYNEDIYLPVCLTGLESGLNSYLSVVKSYKSCLQESLDTGRTVGVCDQINSIYLCEFFWREALPLAELTLPKVVGALTGGNTRGGGEYSNLAVAWDNAKNSVNFFTEFYATNSYSAFKARSQEEIGSEICKSFISVDYPKGQEVLDRLTVKNSPPQYSGNFEVIPFTTATVPPVSQYKVFYHIYAGEDEGAYYKVYLRGGSGGSYYQDTFSGRMVASGYVPIGEYVTETREFTSPEGYQELCIAINNEEECGFKQVSTSFAFDYVRDKSRQAQIENIDVGSQEECVSGSANIYGMLNLNVQEGVENTINPEIYNQGITRVCSTDNPGSGSDPYVGSDAQRWVDVGHCGDTSLRCWMDTKSIDRALDFQTSVNDSLDELTKRTNENLENKEGYLNPQEFALAIENLSIEESNEKKFEMIQNLLGKVYLNNHKGYLYYLRGGIYDEIVRELFAEFNKTKGKVGLDGLTYDVGTETVFDIVTAEDFESGVFEFHNARAALRLGSNQPNVCYKYFNGSWHWTLYCGEIGEYDIRAGENINWISVEILINPYSGAELSDKSKEFIPKLIDKTYFEGLDLLMKRTKINKEGGIVNSIGISNTFISGGPGKDVFFDHEGRCSIYSESQNTRIYFFFKEGKWEYSITFSKLGGDTWKNVNELPLDRELSGDEKLLFKTLEGLDLMEGLTLLFGDVSPQDIKVTYIPSGWTCESIFERMNELEGNYNSNMEVRALVEGLYSQGFLNKEEYNEMRGVNEFGQAREMVAPDVSYLKTILDDCRKEDFVDDSFEIPSGETCPVPESPSEEVLKINDARERVLTTLKELEGHYAPGGDSSCHDAIQYIYFQSGVTHNCVYSDSHGRIYDVSGSEIMVEEADSANGCEYVKHCVNDQPTKSCSLNREKGENLDTFEKLGEIESGDILSYVYDSMYGHNVIFIEWTDPDILEAKIFDWNGAKVKPGKTNQFGEVCEGEWIKKDRNGNRYCKTYQFDKVSLQDDEHPVYMYWEPVIVGRSEEISETEIPNSGLVGKNFEEEETVESQYSLDSAIEKAGSLSGSYETSEENKEFIDNLLEQGIINRVEFYQISNKWGAYQVTPQMSDLKTLLEDIKKGAERKSSMDDLRKDIFNNFEKKLFLEAEKCDRCGEGWSNVCDERECFVLGIALDKNCNYESGFISGKCLEK